MAEMKTRRFTLLPDMLLSAGVSSVRFPSLSWLGCCNAAARAGRVFGVTMYDSKLGFSYGKQ